jgi:S-adenosylmethionine:tRNA-ribosyltransferase-isomerase (queuine synthetase)
METALFDYDLPESFIAQQPAEPRDSSRLLVLHRRDGRIEHRIFRKIGDYLRAGDLLVANDSRVIPARLHGRKPTGGEVEIFLLRQQDDAGVQWECLVRGRNLREGVIWIRPDTEEARETTQEMAEDYIRMGCAEVKAMSAPGGNPNTGSSKTLLVVGGGVTGMTTAIEARVMRAM